MAKQIQCEQYDRIVGYFAPWNRTAKAGKREEIKERKRFDANVELKQPGKYQEAMI